MIQIGDGISIAARQLLVICEIVLRDQPVEERCDIWQSMGISGQTISSTSQYPYELLREMIAIEINCIILAYGVLLPHPRYEDVIDLEGGKLTDWFIQNITAHSDRILESELAIALRGINVDARHSMIKLARYGSSRVREFLVPHLDCGVVHY